MTPAATCHSVNHTLTHREANALELVLSRSRSPHNAPHSPSYIYTKRGRSWSERGACRPGRGTTMPMGAARVSFPDSRPQRSQSAHSSPGAPQLVDTEGVVAETSPPHLASPPEPEAGPPSSPAAERWPPSRPSLWRSRRPWSARPASACSVSSSSRSSAATRSAAAAMICYI